MAKEKYEYSEKVTTSEFRGAFVKLFSPEVDDKGKKTWGVTAIFAKGADMAPLKKAAMDAATKAWGDKAAEKLKHPKFRSPFKDGATLVDKEGNLYDGFAEGQVVVKLSTKQSQPGIVDANVQAIIEPEGVKSGDFFRATINAMAYDRDDGMGVAFKLNNIQKVRDGERLGGGGRADPATEFEAYVSSDAKASGTANDLWT
jgi:hypothetical protein